MWLFIRAIVQGDAEYLVVVRQGSVFDLSAWALYRQGRRSFLECSTQLPGCSDVGWIDNGLPGVNAPWMFSNNPASEGEDDVGKAGMDIDQAPNELWRAGVVVPEDSEEVVPAELASISEPATGHQRW